MNIGYNVRIGRYEDLVGSGVIDPTRVPRFALQKSASVAGLLRTTESVVIERPEKDKSPAARRYGRRRHGGHVSKRSSGLRTA